MSSESAGGLADNLRSRSRLSVHFVLFGVGLCATGGARAAEPSEYCGLYSVYGASVALGRPIEFKELLQAKYISGQNGSSAVELVEAATDFGFAASVFSGLGIETLRTAECPMILHVAAGEQLQYYNHWMLYLGCDGDQGLVVDAVDGAQWLPLAQIMARWDQNAILVGRRAASGARIRAGELRLYLQYAVATLGALLLARFLARAQLAKMGRGLAAVGLVRFCGRETAVILVVGVLAGVSHHWGDSAGFFRNPGATAFVAAAHSEWHIPKLSLAEAQSLEKAGTVVFIDARFARDFQAGHIPGARNIPIDARAEQRAAALSQFSRDQSLVIYCQSVGCRFADVVANSLIREGFTRVSQFPGGWAEWETGTAAAQPAQPTDAAAR